MIGFNINGAQRFNDISSEPGSENTAEMGRKHRFDVVMLLAPDRIDNQIINFNAKSVTLPKVDYDEIVVHNGQSEIYMPGKHKLKPVEIVFYDVLKRSGNTYKSVVVNNIMGRLPTGVIIDDKVFIADRYKYRSNYQFTTYINKVDGAGRTIQKFELYECYISNVDPGDLSYADNEIVEISMTLKYNKMVTTGV